MSLHRVTQFIHLRSGVADHWRAQRVRRQAGQHLLVGICGGDMRRAQLRAAVPPGVPQQHVHHRRAGHEALQGERKLDQGPRPLHPKFRWTTLMRPRFACSTSCYQPSQPLPPRFIHAKAYCTLTSYFCRNSSSRCLICAWSSCVASHRTSSSSCSATDLLLTAG